MARKQPQQEKTICGAKTRRGGTCGHKPMANGRCRYHGGLTPKGPDSPHWKTGKHSKYNLAGRLQVAYLAALDDPDLTSLKHELAALDAVTADMATNLDGVDRDAVAKMQANQQAIRDAITAGDAEALNAAMDAQDNLLNADGRRMQLVFDLAKLMEQRSKIAAREHRRMVQLDVMVRFDELLVRIGMLMEAVRSHVRDNATIALIATEWQRILGPLPRGITEDTAAAHDRDRSELTEADTRDDQDAELRRAFQTAMQRLGCDEATSGRHVETCDDKQWLSKPSGHVAT